MITSIFDVFNDVLQPFPFVCTRDVKNRCYKWKISNLFDADSLRWSAVPWICLSDKTHSTSKGQKLMSYHLKT